MQLSTVHLSPLSSYTSTSQSLKPKLMQALSSCHVLPRDSRHRWCTVHVTRVWREMNISFLDCMFISYHDLSRCRVFWLLRLCNRLHCPAVPICLFDHSATSPRLAVKELIIPLPSAETNKSDGNKVKYKLPYKQTVCNLSSVFQPYNSVLWKTLSSELNPEL